MDRSTQAAAHNATQAAAHQNQKIRPEAAAHQTPKHRTWQLALATTRPLKTRALVWRRRRDAGRRLKGLVGLVELFVGDSELEL